MAMKRVKYKTKSGKTAYRNIRGAAAPSGAKRKRVAKSVDSDSTLLYHAGMRLLGSGAGHRTGVALAPKTGYSGLHGLGGTVVGHLAGRGLAHATEKKLSATARARLGAAAGAAGLLLHGAALKATIDHDFDHAFSKFRGQMHSRPTGPR